ncbi:MAG: hypothetical protein PHI85_10685 [Victivallaceae bacterium]|nr:hypothetical protein [Victivallaceae bacterium]
MKFYAVLLATLGLLGAAQAQDDNACGQINVWPRHSQVNMPTKLKQFMFVEVPHQSDNGPFTLNIKFPPEITLLGTFSGVSPAVPVRPLKPEEFKQDGTKAVLNFPGGEFKPEGAGWLSLYIDVNTPVGEYPMSMEAVAADGKLLSKGSFTVKIYPELVNRTIKSMPIIAYYYTGIDEDYVAPFLEQMKACGVNALHSMSGEWTWAGAVPGKTVAGEAPQYGIEAGVIFFSKEIADYAQKNIGQEYTLQRLIDEPEKLTAALKGYIDHATAGKPHQAIIYDAEAGSVRADHVEGDLSEYSRAKFSREVGADHTLTAEEIFDNHRDAWMWFNCRQTNSIAAAARSMIDEYYPGVLFYIYSGYEYDFGAEKDMSRRSYSVDWNSAADTLPDYAGAGYYGTRDDLRHTNEVLDGRTTFIPADMYLENFLHEGAAPTTDQWKMRLIRTFMNSGMRGMALWYSAVMDGSALIAVSEFVRFVELVEDFALRGHLDENAITVTPKSEAENVYVIRDSRQAKVVLLNSGNRPKTFSLTLNDFKIKGYTSDIQITDLTTGEKMAAAKTLRLTVAPMSYRVIQILDDGN